MILDLVDDTDPILRQELEPFDFENPPCDPIELVVNMVETMRKHAGIGLAANQVGLPYRMFVMEGQPPIACFNPRIVDKSLEEVELEEACLTFPTLTCNVFRYRHIKVRYINFDGQIVNSKFTGMSARVFQHELDHLNGIFFFDNLKPLHRERTLRKWKSLKRRLKHARNILY